MVLVRARGPRPCPGPRPCRGPWPASARNRDRLWVVGRGLVPRRWFPREIRLGTRARGLFVWVTPLTRTSRASGGCHASCAGGGHDPNEQTPSTANESTPPGSGTLARDARLHRSTTSKRGETRSIPRGPATARGAERDAQSGRVWRTPRRQSAASIRIRARLRLRDAGVSAHRAELGLRRRRCNR